LPDYCLTVGAEMISSQGLRNIVWIASISIGPAIAYYLIGILGRLSWICKNPYLCRVRIFVFFAVGFGAVWAVYWAGFLMARAIRHKKPEEPGSNARL
jgi:hypothetical protein